MTPINTIDEGFAEITRLTRVIKERHNNAALSNDERHFLMILLNDIVGRCAEIQAKFISSNPPVMKPFPSDAELDDLALNYINDSTSVHDYNLKLEAFKGACHWWYEHGKGNVS